MLQIAQAPLAVSVSRAGGLGFLAGGFNLDNLLGNLEHAAKLVAEQQQLSQQQQHDGTLPIGVGFINWGADLSKALTAISTHTPAAVWFFGASNPADENLAIWAREIRKVTNGRTKIWAQIGTVADALKLARRIEPDVLVLQGSDAGGHGMRRSASILALVPEVRDALAADGRGEIPVVAAGGIVDGRGVAAALCLGASGAVMGTRFLASTEASIATGYKQEILRATDGGVNTVRSTVYDRLRGIYEWPEEYDGRGLINASFLDAERGMSDEQNRLLYQEETKKGDEGWGPGGRMTTYAGTGVGLVKDVKSAGDIVRSVSQQAEEILQGRK